MKDKNRGLFLTIKELKKLGIIDLDNDKITIRRKRKKRSKKTKKNTKKNVKKRIQQYFKGGLDYSQIKSDSSQMIGGGSSHQLKVCGGHFDAL